MSKKKPAPKLSKSFEESLWETAIRLRGSVELGHNGRWNSYKTPAAGNANYVWILHIDSTLAEHGVAGFILTNDSISTNTTSKSAIRQKMVENDLIKYQIHEMGSLKNFTHPKFAA